MDASKKSWDDVTDAQLTEAAEATVGFMFDGAEEIGSSDISAAVRDTIRRLGFVFEEIPAEKRLRVREFVRSVIRYS